MDGVRKSLGGNFNSVYFELDTQSKQEHIGLSPEYLTCTMCIVSFDPHNSAKMIILPSFRKPIQNVSSHCPWPYSLPMTEPGFT